MKPVQTDVDIDCFNRDKILEGVECIYGRIDRSDNRFEKHPTGVYFQNIPRDPTTNISTVDHRIANDYGYFKIDFLNVNMYESVVDESHLLTLLNREPPWDFFDYEEITDQLFHLKGYSRLLKQFKPKSVEDLAMVLAIIRPSKAYLQKESWEKIKKEVWIKNEGNEGNEGYGFKKSHGIAYALAIIVNLNLLIEKMSKE
jgi:DNA polymerase III alpha subunit